MSDCCEKLAASLSQMNAALGRIETRLNGLENRVRSLENGKNTQKGKDIDLSDILRRLSKLESETTVISDCLLAFKPLLDSLKKFKLFELLGIEDAS